MLKQDLPYGSVGHLTCGSGTVYPMVQQNLPYGSVETTLWFLRTYLMASQTYSTVKQNLPFGSVGQPTLWMIRTFHIVQKDLPYG